jgi:hypothetical protein
VTTLLDGWGTAERIEDLLFMPTEKTSMMAT